MIKLWKCGSSLEMSPFSASSTAPREEGKMKLEGHSPSHFQIISEFLCAAGWNSMNRWAGLCYLLLDFGLGGWLLGHFSLCFVYRGSPVLLGFGSLVDHWGVGFGPWWTEKIGLYKTQIQFYVPRDSFGRVITITGPSLAPCHRCLMVALFEGREIGHRNLEGRERVGFPFPSVNLV